jgi:hypothetical protein
MIRHQRETIIRNIGKWSASLVCIVYDKRQLTPGVKRTRQVHLSLFSYNYLTNCNVMFFIAR